MYSEDVNEVHLLAAEHFFYLDKCFTGHFPAASELQSVSPEIRGPYCSWFISPIINQLFYPKSVCHTLVWSCYADLGDLLSQGLTHENADVLSAWGPAPAPVPRLHPAEMMFCPVRAGHLWTSMQGHFHLLSFVHKEQK